MAESRSDWVEILEPRSRRRMYVNLSTGECGWDPPRGIAPRPADGRQWWELFDVASGRFYYYNPVGRRTVWHRPRGCDIVPLARLQAVKLGSEAERGGAAGGAEREAATEGRCATLAGNGPFAPPPLQELDGNPRETPPGYPAYGSVGRKDALRDVSQRWQPAPGSKGTMLMKVHSMGRSRTAGAPSAPMLHQRRSSSSSIAVGTPCGPPAGVWDTGRALRAPTPSVRGYTPCCPTGSSLRVVRVPTSRAESPRPGTEAPPTYDEPPAESPVYDEPPADMEVEGAAPTFFGPASKGLDRHAERCPSDYSPAGRACIRHMVNVELPPPRPGSPPPATPPATPTPCQAQQRETARVGKPSWRGLEEALLRGPESRHSRQGSSPSREHPPGGGLTYHDSGYSTRPSPGLRRKSRRRPTVAHGRAASAGARELGVLNERLMAEMRARASRSSLAVELSEDLVPRACSPPRSLQGLAGTPSPEDGVAVGRASLSCRHGDASPAPAPPADAAGGHKRTYEKVDTLEKSATSQISLSSPESPSSPSQGGTLDSQGPAESRTRGGAAAGVATLDSHRAGRGATGGGGPGPSPGDATPPDAGMADWATKHLNLQKRGLFRRRISLGSLLSWSGGSLRGPMLITSDRAVKREACHAFRLVQAYMGDRASRLDRRHTALLLVTKCWALPGLRDELYVQLVRQTTRNLRPASLAAGWELMAICLGFFAPSPKFRHYLEGYIQRHLDPEPEATDYGAEQQDVKNKKNSKSRKKRKQNTEEEDEGLPVSTYAKYCYRRLQKVALTGGKKGLRKPTLEEVDHFRSAIETPSLFGSSLQEVMERQRELFPDRRLPWVQVQLSQYVLALGGTRTEGIFRVPGDIDEVNALKLQVEQWRTPENLSDPNVPASLLKLWYRELEEPLIPPTFYSQCIGNCEDPTVAVAVVQSLPELSRLVLCYFIHFLQIFAQPANVSKTKMDANNLAMVMAPNCLRCQSEDPRVIFENTRKEMAFLRLLIVHLDTSFMKGVV